MRDVEEVLEELRSHVLIRVVVPRQLQGDREHVEAVRRHPTPSVALVEPHVIGKLTAVEDANVVEAQEAALEDVATLGVFAIHPPSKVDEQFVKDTFEELCVTLAPRATLDLIHAHSGPGMDRRVYVAELPLGGRQ